jgi:membrane-bound lytic murein transglycosylase D
MARTVGKCLVLWVGIPLSLGIAQTNYSTELFPMPEAIRNNVEFWKKIYTVYPTTAALIHDMDDMSLIYEVVDLSGDAHLPYRQQLQKLEKIKDEYRSYLRDLLNGRLQTTNNPRAERVLQLYGTTPDPMRLERAMSAMRGQFGIMDRFYQGLQRSGLYRDAIIMTFTQHGLPMELIMLPHVESSFNYRAYSKVGAAGMWQFMRYTGRLFMTINYDVDERLDPIRSTEAAAKLLQLNYSELGSWPLAITAYNHGLNGMKRAQALYGDDFGKIYAEYESRSFGFASRNFYAQFLAALEVASDHENYFGPVEFHKPSEFIEIKLDHYITVNRLMEVCGLDLEEFSDLNPALRPPVTKSQRRIPKNYTLRLPKRLGLDGYALASRLGQGSQFDRQIESDWYRVQRGDNLAAIAARYNLSIRELTEYNNLSSPQRIDAGTILKIPPKRPTMLASAEPLGPASSSDAAHTETFKEVTPLKTEPAAPLAIEESIMVEPPAGAATALVTESTNATPPISREEREAIITYDHEVEKILPSKPSAISVAEARKAPLPPPVPAAKQPDTRKTRTDWITVEPEETLGHYATWLEVSTRRLRELNGLRYNQDIHIGQRIRLSYDRINAEEFENRRFEYQRSIQEDFFSTYQVDSVKPYGIKPGQNIWQICTDVFQVPMWLVVKYNPDRDLAKLKPGDELMIPNIVAINPEATPSLAE